MLNEIIYVERNDEENEKPYHISFCCGYAYSVIDIVSMITEPQLVTHSVGRGGGGDKGVPTLGRFIYKNGDSYHVCFTLFKTICDCNVYFVLFMIYIGII